MLYRAIRAFTGPADASWQTRTQRWALLTLAVAGLGVGIVAGFELVLNASSGGLGKLLALLADTLDQIRASAPPWIVERLPESANSVQHAVSQWLREHAGEVQRWGTHALEVLVHIIIGLAIGLMAGAATVTAARNDNGVSKPAVLRLAQERLQHLAIAFADVLGAQLRIALINALVTGVYLIGVLPLLGYRVPLAPTLVAFTFFASLLPILGNLLSNAAIVLAALTVSFWLGVASLVFLVVIHKLEYVLTARIVGGRTNVPTYAMLASMLVLEAAFGLGGLVAAPVYAAWLTRELREGGWI